MSEICKKIIDEFLFAKTVLRKSLNTIPQNNKIDNSFRKSDNELVKDNNNNNNNNNSNEKISGSLIKLGTVKIGGFNTDILTRIIIDGIIYSTWNIFVCTNKTNLLKKTNVSILCSFVLF